MGCYILLPPVFFELLLCYPRIPGRKKIITAGLYPCVGYFHKLAGAKMPLVYDIMKLYRQLIDLSTIPILEIMMLKKAKID
ncbi:CRISPR-associated endonuclease Cas1 [Methanooceanicella nereidis]|uniref:CRISPR-associated endonuclease Cas1 n=1 Tax=Methanooceanicella nereidis TaxID=2052831 RepID=UPI0034E23320